MAGLPQEPPDYVYGPLREPPDPLRIPKPEELDILEAFDVIDSDFKIEVPDSAPPSVRPEDYENEPEPPQTIEDAEAQLTQAQQRIEEYQRQLEAFVTETRSMVPMDRAQANEVKRRAGIIARSRRDIDSNLKGIQSAKQLIAKAASAREEDPSLWQQALGVGAKALGAVGMFLENTPLAGVSETFLGLLSPAFEGAAGDVYKSVLVDNEYVSFEWAHLAQAPLSIFGVGSADWGVRKRGRQVGQAVGRALTIGEELILDTPVLRELYRYAPPTAAFANMPDVAAWVTGMNVTDIREFRNQLLFEIATDPLNLIDFGGVAITKLGRLRKIARVNSGALETAAFMKALDDVPEVAKLAPEFAGRNTDALIAELRKAGADADHAANIAQAFDFARAQNLKDMRGLASQDAGAWSAVTREYVERAPKTPGTAKQIEALGKIEKFGEDVDPILGRTFREQAALGQRMKAWDRFFEKFGSSNLVRVPEKFWGRLTGESIFADIVDNPEAVELYFAQRAFKADAGSEVLRYQQDVTARQADILNRLNPEQQETILKQLPSVVEHTTPDGRAALRQGIDVKDQPLKAALVDLADLYDESAATLRAIENRFGLQVAEFMGDFRYFGRELSDELKQWLLENPKARAILFGDTTRRSKEYLSAALLPEESGRTQALRNLDFEASESYMRNLFPGLPSNIPIWNKNAFGQLVERADRALQQAHLRNLYDNFVQAHAGKVHPQTVETMGAKIAGMVDAAAEDMASVAGVVRPDPAATKTQQEAAQRARRVAEGARVVEEHARRAADQAREAETAAEAAWRQAAAEMRTAGGNAEQAKAAAKQARDDYFAAQEAFNKGQGAARDAASDAMKSATRRMKEAIEELKRAKAADDPERVRRAQERVEAAKEAYNKARADTEQKTAGAEAMREAVETARKAADKADAEYASAVKAAEDAALKASKHHPNNWTPKAKAEWLLGKMKRGEIPGAQGTETNALEVLLRAKVKPPDDWKSLARLAATNLDTHAANEFQKLAEGLFWKRFEKPGNLGKAFDAIKAIYQRSTLARVASLTKDLWGTAVNGLMSGNVTHLDRAMREVGSFLHWQKEHQYVGDAANRLKAQGVLRTTKGEALDKPGELEAILGGKLGKVAGRIEREGIVGGTLQSIGAPRTGKAASKVLGGVNDARVYWEEVNRVATYLKAVDEGMGHAEAVAEVYKFWGKFDELSRIERKWLNRILFFWSWQARSIPVTIRHIMEHPVRSKLLLAAMAGNTESDDKMPDWMRRMGGFALGRDENGRVRVANVAGSTYFSPTFSMLQGQFVSQALQGKPMEAVSGAMRDLIRATPPYLQAIPEMAFSYDFFQDKPWWRDRNAKTGSNAKAPTWMAWFYDDGSNSGLQGKITDLLGLKATLNDDGSTKFLSMDPNWAWFFGALPGVEPAMTDAGAFFSLPKEPGGKPELDLVKGAARQFGAPLYDVNLETAVRQIYEFKQAVLKDAGGLSGGSLYAQDGRLAPDKKTYRGNEIANFIERVRFNAKAQGLSGEAIDDMVLERMKDQYPQEWRVMALWDRLEAWEDYVLAVEEGPDLTPRQQETLELVGRRADYDRLGKYERKRLDELIAKAGR